MSSATRTPDEIAAEITVTRDRLAGTIDQLVYRVHPKTIAKREAASIKSRFVHEDGSPNTGFILKTVGIAVGAVATVVAIRKLVG